MGLFLQLLPTKPFPLFRNVVQLRRFEFPIRIRSILRQISGPFFFAKKFSFSADNLQKYSLKKKKKKEIASESYINCDVREKRTGT